MIYHDKTKVKGLQQYLSKKQFMLIELWGLLILKAIHIPVENICMMFYWVLAVLQWLKGITHTYTLDTRHISFDARVVTVR